MGDKKNRKKLISRKRLPEFREWVNVSVGLAALLLAFVSFWTTARISGLEDYLRSEITRQNTELDTLSKRSQEIEKLALEKERELVRLNSAAVELQTSAYQSQMQLASSQAKLMELRSDSFAARLALADTRAEQARLSRDLKASQNEFDLFRRQQAYFSYSIGMGLSAFYEFEEDEPSGAALLKTILARQPDRGSQALAGYFGTVRQNFERLCPDFSAKRLSLPAISPKPDTPTIRYLSNASQTEIDRLTKEAQDKYSRELSEHFESRRKRSEASFEAITTLIDDASKCICLSLSEDVYTMDQVCPNYELSSLRNKIRKIAESDS